METPKLQCIFQRTIISTLCTPRNQHKKQRGATVYSYPPPICFARSKVWKGNIKQLQQEISTISRIVIHPKYRSIGLGTKLVKQTLPQTPTPNIETVAVMAKYNPFFEKAGMQQIAQNKPNKHITKALESLTSLGFNTTLMTNTQHNEKLITQIGCKKITDILEELSKNHASVRRRLAGLSNVYPRHHEFTEKIRIRRRKPGFNTKTVKLHDPN